VIARWEDHSAFNIYITYYRGTYSGTYQQITVFTFSLSGNRVLYVPFDYYRDISNKILKYVTFKGKLSTSALGEDEAFP